MLPAVVRPHTAWGTALPSFLRKSAPPPVAQRTLCFLAVPRAHRLQYSRETPLVPTLLPLPHVATPQPLRQHTRLFAIGSPREVCAVEELPRGEGYSTIITSGRHTLSADLMPAAGGQDKGPSPKEYAMAALASCTAMTMRIFSDNMVKSGKWKGPVRKISVRCEEFGKHPHVPDGIRIHVNVDGDLSDAERERLLAAAGKCPVKKMFTGHMKDGITTAYEPSA